jgi:DNA-binding CsgD family transcriptional regulator
MLAAFDYSWQQLEPAEQSAFAHLSVFRGGFDRAAAEAVAGASLPVLSALVDKSLLRWTPGDGQGAGGRYYIHELLRQFGQEKLTGEPGQLESIRRKHGLYFTTFVHSQLPLVLGERQLQFTATIATEIENIRVAWLWATESADAAALQKAGHVMANYYQFVGHYIEGHATFLKAAEALAGAEQSAQTEKTLATTGLGTDPRTALGILASIEGDYEATARYGEKIHRTSEAYDNFGNVPFGLYLLTRAALGQGDYQAARRYALQGYATAKATGERWFLAYTLMELGNVEFALNNYTAAREHYEAALAIRSEFNDPEGVALATVQLGTVALRERKFAEAEERFCQGLELYEEINDRGGLARTLDGLGQTAAATGRQRAACDHYREALQFALDIHFVPVILSLLEGIGELLAELDEIEPGLSLLARAASHPRGEHETRRRADLALSRHKSKVPVARFDEAVQEGSSAELASLAKSTLAELLRLESEVDRQAAEDTPMKRPKQEAQALIEPLTNRELEVLALIAQGMSNKQIADALIVSIGTVKWYTSQIYGKLGVKSRTQAVAKAHSLKLIP